MGLLGCPDATLISCKAARRGANRHQLACSVFLAFAAQAEPCVSSIRLRNGVSSSQLGIRSWGTPQLPQVCQT